MRWKERQHKFSLEDKDKAQLTGLVFDIQRFAVHDGGGIRTLVFLKGCPLKCKWCQNPESMSSKPEIMRIPHHCISCVKCATLCPEQAIVIKENFKVEIDRDKCTYCGECVENCYAGSMTIVGRYLTVDEVMEEVERDRPFYNTSGGGVTFSGGEPTLQSAFLLTALKEAHKRGLHTAIESCCFCAQETFAKVLEHTDLVLTDIKHMDSAKHEELTGVPNEQILSNIKMAAERGKTLRIRIPLIPGCNDSEENIEATAQFVASLGGSVEGLDILPYHRLGEPKWEQLDREYALNGVIPPNREHVLALKNLVLPHCPNVSVGG
ncbi:pyruvate formate lyase activating enzyme [Maridesulfovibrio ferrireducens]|uniref:Pyruvate formate lyase activating enzyme n=1 Tax=Maridesulfovibrio ferrireducens TaxID=246191 RepID=A0A1G9KSW4_9BACT|nr:glycyl-radical enzyme activating protein [Maridesulfovibrio ferrireducens]SDL52613.1 pyruvate formate lyase activating enzyme [Maridesulfovibrio ferrireducens]